MAAATAQRTEAAAAAAAAPAPTQQEPPSSSGRGAVLETAAGIAYRQYVDERDLPAVMALIDRDLPEPYSIFTYRYFLLQWPHLCFLAHDTQNGGAPCGVIVCKMDVHRGKQTRGYIAMLAVDSAVRGRGIGSRLGRMAIRAMAAGGAEEVALEAEATNAGALALYRALGFARDKRLHRYYLSGNDAYRLKLQLPLTDKAHARRRREREAILGIPEAMDALGDAAAAAEDDGLDGLPPAEEGLIA